MKKFNNQILAGTRLDSQGEKIPKEVLDNFAMRYSNSTMPLNQEHDLSLDVAGHVENLRVVSDPDIQGEWCLVGDVVCDSSLIKNFLGGFSISFLEILKKSNKSAEFYLYLPHPYYKDDLFLDELFEEGYVSVGRWAKKSGDPVSIALIGFSSFVAFLIKPVWDDLYKTQIAPKIYDFFNRKFKKLKDKNITIQLVQKVKYGNRYLDIYFLPIPGKEEACFNLEAVAEGMRIAHSTIVSIDFELISYSKIFLKFDEEKKSYIVLRCE